MEYVSVVMKANYKYIIIYHYFLHLFDSKQIIEEEKVAVGIYSSIIFEVCHYYAGAVVALCLAVSPLRWCSGSVAPDCYTTTLVQW